MPTKAFVKFQQRRDALAALDRMRARGNAAKVEGWTPRHRQAELQDLRIVGVAVEQRVRESVAADAQAAFKAEAQLAINTAPTIEDAQQRVGVLLARETVKTILKGRK
ncbi:MAG: hypothetical protein ACHQQS_06600 [Thermoanaerobaculales bacterium]